MAMLYIIGLGLGDEKDITIRGLEAVKSCKKVYIEAYTSLLSFGLSSDGLSIMRVFKSTSYGKMKHILKILGLLVAVSAVWIGLLEASIIPSSYAWMLPVYLIVSLGCYGLLMVGVGLMFFPTCPQEAHLLHKDIAEAKEYLKNKGLNVGAD